MTKTTNPLRSALEEVLAPAGFARKKDSWFRSTDEVVEVVNLQKSQYGRQYYLNYGLWLQALGDAKFPREEQCHIRMRADSIVLSEAEFARLLDLENGTTDTERKREFARVLSGEFLRFAETCRTVSGLRSLLADGKLKGALVLASAKRVTGSSPAP